MAKLESCVGTSAGRRTGQSVRWATWSEMEMLGRILLMTDFVVILLEQVKIQS